MSLQCLWFLSSQEFAGDLLLGYASPHTKRSQIDHNNTQNIVRISSRGRIQIEVFTHEHGSLGRKLLLTVFATTLHNSLIV